MTYGYQMTREEEACKRLLEEIREELSEAARTVIAEAAMEAYKFNLCSTYAYQPEEFDEAKAIMRLAATDLTDRDCELLRAYVRATIAAFASIDRYDVDTFVGHEVNRADLHDYYEMKWEMIDDSLTFREGQVRRQEAAKQDPTATAGIPKPCQKCTETVPNRTLLGSPPAARLPRRRGSRRRPVTGAEGSRGLRPRRAAGALRGGARGEP